MSVLHRVDVGDGSLLDVVSGLEAVSRRFDAIVAQYVPGAPPPEGTDDPRTLDLLLGLVAVRERLRTVLANASVESETRDANAAPVMEESWLR